MRRPDFTRHILHMTGHRPWPIPGSRWIMTQTWHDLLFAHWPVPVEVLRDKVPASFEIDLFEGGAWVGVVPFFMTNVAPRGAPALPWLSAFAELNVRTYVRVGDKPGVYFFSLDAANPVAVRIARTLAHLPYYSASMRVDARGGDIHYASRRTTGSAPPAEFVARYRPAGPVREAQPESLEYFLTERYCLYTADRARRPYRLDIHHPRWALQPAEADISVNTMADAAGIRLPAGAPLLNFSKRQDMVAWPLARLT